MVLLLFLYIVDWIGYVVSDVYDVVGVEFFGVIM